MKFIVISLLLALQSTFSLAQFKIKGELLAEGKEIVVDANSHEQIVRSKADYETSIYTSSEYVLNTTDDWSNTQRNEHIQNVMEWAKINSNQIPINDSYAKKLMDINQILWMHYVVCMANVYLSNSSLGTETLAVQSTQLLISFLKNENNIGENSLLQSDSIRDNLFLKELFEIKTEKKIARFIARS